MKKNTQSKRPKAVTSAFVFNENKDESAPDIKNGPDTAKQPISASVFMSDESVLTFKTRLRNIIQFTFESLRDSLTDQKPITAFLRRSLGEMKSLSTEAAQRLSADTSRRFNELIEEITTFSQEEKVIPINTDELQSVAHYRHYVRIAWLSHYILEDLSTSTFSNSPNSL